MGETMDTIKVKRTLNYLLLFWALDAICALSMVILPRVYPGHILSTILAGLGALLHLVFGGANAIFLYRLLVQVRKPWLFTILCYAVTLFFCFPLQWALIAVYSSIAKKVVTKAQEDGTAFVPSA